MLRASKITVLSADNIQCNNGYVLSTVINLNGLIINANYPINPAIKNFLFFKNIQLETIEAKFQPNSHLNSPLPSYENYIKIFGNFSISRKEILHFINSREYNYFFPREYQQGVVPKHVLEKAENLHACIEQQYESCLQHAEYSDESHVWSIEFAGIFADRELICNIENFTLSNDILARESIDITTKNLKTTGRILSYIDDKQREYRSKAGLMSSFLSKKHIHIIFTENTNLQDAVLGSEQIIIESQEKDSTLKLSVNPNIDWLNNPQPDFKLLLNPQPISKYRFHEKEITLGYEEPQSETPDPWVYLTKHSYKP